MTSTAAEIEQFRPGFEAWATGPDGEWLESALTRAGNGDYIEPEIREQFKGWIASKREASTEPSVEYAASYAAYVAKCHAGRIIPCTLGSFKAEHERLIRESVTDAAKDEPSSTSTSQGTAEAAELLAQQRYTDYVRECRELGLKPASFDAFKVVCAEMECDICTQVLRKCRAAPGDALDARRYRQLFTIVNFQCNPLWPVVRWMRDDEEVSKEEIDAALDEVHEMDCSAIAASTSKGDTDAD